MLDQRFRYSSVKIRRVLGAENSCIVEYFKLVVEFNRSDILHCLGDTKE